MLLEGKSYNTLHQCCTRVCSRYWIMVGNTFHTSDHTHRDTTSPASSKTNGGAWQFFQRLLRAFLTTAALWGTPTAPQGKPQHFHIRIFFIQQVTKLLGQSVGRLGSWMFCMSTEIRFFFPFLQDIQQRLGKWRADDSQTRAGCDATVWECSSAGSAERLS